MSVSKTSFSDPRVPSSAGDDLDVLPDKLPLPAGRQSTFKPPSKFSIDAMVCSSDSLSDNSAATKRIAGTNTSSLSILKPSMVTGVPVTAPNQPLPTGISQEPLPRDVPFPFPLANGIAPLAKNYPSSYPVLKRYPIPPYPPQQTVAPASQTCFHAMPSTQDESPELWSRSYGSLVTTQAPFGSPLDFRQPTTNNQQPSTSTQQPESLPDIGDERPAKRRRIGDGIDLITSIYARLPGELPIWHESKIVANEDPTPYMEFLGLAGPTGKSFVAKIFSCNRNLDSGQTINAHRDFVEKLFTYLSSALEKRQLGATQLSDNQLGKLVVASFVLTKRIACFLKNSGGMDLFNYVVYLALEFINKNNYLFLYLKEGIQMNDQTTYHLFGGKVKFRLMIWCAEQGIALNQEELKFLSTENFKAQLSEGALLLKELRNRVMEQKKNATS